MCKHKQITNFIYRERNIHLRTKQIMIKKISFVFLLIKWFYLVQNARKVALCCYFKFISTKDFKISFENINIPFILKRCETLTKPLLSSLLQKSIVKQVFFFFLFLNLIHFFSLENIQIDKSLFFSISPPLPQFCKILFANFEIFLQHIFPIRTQVLEYLIM